ncbi:spermidine/putrescine ABC transporter substrate-binding protein [Chitinimonas sp. BJB300]|nr:spermidine/putrescine ABC transporter substrate-binding protein [Chitinimonas sp. BJB300]TSJ90169.1 spermidine/putrescine ABC transporter substrate-binding protein [Chitinimonas sp. BJB300]
MVLLAAVLTPCFAADLQLYNWGDYLSQEAIKRFEAQCSCRVVQTTYGTMDEMLENVAEKGKVFDVMVPSNYAVASLAKKGLLQPLDRSKITRMNNVAKAFANPAYDPNNRYSVPYAFTSTLLGYNVDKMRELGIDTSSYKALFDPESLAKLMGRVFVINDSREVIAAALVYNGFSPNSTDPAELTAAKASIELAKPYWAGMSFSSPLANQTFGEELALGNIWIALGFSSDFFIAQSNPKAARRHIKIEYRYQQEGNVLGVDNLVIHRKSANQELAHQFINFMLDGKNSAALTNEIGSGNPNEAAKSYVRQELRSSQAIFPSPAAAKSLRQLTAWDSNVQKAFDAWWVKLKGG